MKSRSRSLLASTITGVLAFASVAGAQQGEPGTGKIPKVELYMNQQGVLVRPGDALTARVTGAVYDAPLLFGDIGLAPNNDLPTGPTNPACPLFVSGSVINTSAPIGQNVLSVPVILRVPAATAPGSYNCALKYVAIYKSPFTGISYFVGKGNQVNIPYTVRRAR
ncbi:MAG TPA: hypothetical protein VE153_33875 [Myxococcus sp.]|nr:hypothetical protein [Myxococcus sp.]